MESTASAAIALLAQFPPPLDRLSRRRQASLSARGGESAPSAAIRIPAFVPDSGLDHDDFGLNQPKIMNVIDSNNLERDAGGKPVPPFPHPALAVRFSSRAVAKKKPKAP
jgi:hypothetical protein